MLESLQEALEDVHYVKALKEGRLPPSKALPMMMDHEIEAYIAKLPPESLLLEKICAHPLGFYMFISFVKEAGSPDLANFLIESAIIQMNHTTDGLKILRKLVCDYLLDTPTQVPSIQSPPPQRFIPSLSRRVYPELNVDELQVTFEKKSDGTVKLSGKIVEQILSEMGMSEKPKSGQGLNTKDLAILDMLVFNQVKKLYFNLFKLSPDWKKLFYYKAIIENYVPCEEDFEHLRMLGRGGFGRVFAVRHITTGKLFALKILSKKRIKYRKAANSCIEERNILVIMNSPYVVGLKYAYDSKEDLFLVLDLMMGGDLSYHLSKCKFSIEQARYYAARTVLGLIQLHEKKFVYRDLKPQNLLLDMDGRSKITDVGLAAEITDPNKGISGVCGTRGYLAPEMINNHKTIKSSTGASSRAYYSFEVDWFSLGCCIYEFFIGVSPFRTDKAKTWGNPDANNRHARDKAMDLAVQEMDPDLSVIHDENARDLISKLLIKDPKKRLGAGGKQEIMSHKWFESIDWKTLHCVSPPFIPPKESNAALGSEIGDFEDENEVCKIKLEPADHEQYQGWTYKNSHGAQEELVELLVSKQTVVSDEPPSLMDDCCCAIS